MAQLGDLVLQSVARAFGPKEAVAPGGPSISSLSTSMAPRQRIEDGIQAVRVMLPKCWFDVDKCSKGVEALKLYRSDYDEKHRVMRPRPIHDWTSHCADSSGCRRSRVANFNRWIEMPHMSVA
jgi:hypothetical protein